MNVFIPATSPSVGQHGIGAWVAVEEGGRRETVRGDHVVCALPFSVTRQKFGKAKLSTEKQRVIREQKYFPVEEGVPANERPILSGAALERIREHRPAV